MRSSRPGTRTMTSSLVVLGVCAALAGCGHPAKTPDPKASRPRPPSSSSTPVPPPPPGGYDLSRVDKVQNDFPAGFAVQAHPAGALTAQDVKGFRVAALSDAVITPVECRAVIVPPYVDAAPGTQAAGVDANGSRGTIHVLALRSPAPVAAHPPPEACDMEMLISGSPEVAGTAERVHAPSIAGATTDGVKLTPSPPNRVYIFTATLDDHTVVTVTGSADSDLDPQQLMADLLVKATAAVRG